jgi:hypothetical protein
MRWQCWSQLMNLLWRGSLAAYFHKEIRFQVAFALRILRDVIYSGNANE